MRCNMTSWSESYSKLERIYKKQIFCCVAFASSKNIKASFFADHKLPWTDLKRLHSQKFKVDITGWVPDEQHIGLWGWESGWVTWRLACRTHRERRCAAEDPDATLPPSLVPPSSPSPPSSSSSSSSPSTVTLMLISGLLEKRKSKIFQRRGIPPGKGGHAEIFRARRLRMIAEGDSPHSHRARWHDKERDSCKRSFSSLPPFNTPFSPFNTSFSPWTPHSHLQKCCWTQSRPAPRRRNFSSCGWAICWEWAGSHWCLSEGLYQSAGRQAKGGSSDQSCDHFWGLHLHLVLHLLHLLVLPRSSHLCWGLRSNSWTLVVHDPEDQSLVKIMWMIETCGTIPLTATMSECLMEGKGTEWDF